DSRLCLLDERSEVTAPHIGLYDDSPLAPATLDRRGACALLDPHELGERKSLPGRDRDDDLLQGLRIFAVSHRESNHKWKAPARLDDMRHVDAADGLDGSEHLLSRQDEAGNGLIVDGHLEDGKPRELLSRRIRSTCDGFHDSLDFPGLGLQRL